LGAGLTSAEANCRYCSRLDVTYWTKARVTRSSSELRSARGGRQLEERERRFRSGLAGSPQRRENRAWRREWSFAFWGKSRSPETEGLCPWPNACSGGCLPPSSFAGARHVRVTR